MAYSRKSQVEGQGTCGEALRGLAVLRWEACERCLLLPLATKHAWPAYTHRQALPRSEDCSEIPWPIHVPPRCPSLQEPPHMHITEDATVRTYIHPVSVLQMEWVLPRV